MIFVFRIISTARKWSLEQGNVFTGVCLSTARGLCPSMHHRSHDRGVSIQGGLCPRGAHLCPGGSLFREGLCPGRVSVQGQSRSRGGGGGLSLSGRLSVQGDPETETPHMVMSGWYASYGVQGRYLCRDSMKKMTCENWKERERTSYYTKSVFLLQTHTKLKTTNIQVQL